MEAGRVGPRGVQDPIQVGEQPKPSPAGQVFREGLLLSSNIQPPLQKSNTRQVVYLGVVVAAVTYLYSPRTFWLLLTAAAVAQLYSQMEKANQPPPPVPEEFAVCLQMKEHNHFAGYKEQTYEFHAIWTMKKVQEEFNEIARWIEQGNLQELAKIHQELITLGNAEYQKYKRGLEKYISLKGMVYNYLDPSNKYVRDVGATLSCGVPDEDRRNRAASKVVTLLTGNVEKLTKVVMLKIGDHPFPVIKQGARIIFFDAPAGEFVLTKNKKAAEEHLKRILQKAVDSFEYTLIDIVAPPKGV